MARPKASNAKAPEEPDVRTAVITLVLPKGTRGDHDFDVQRALRSLRALGQAGLVELREPNEGERQLADE